MLQARTVFVKNTGDKLFKTGWGDEKIEIPAGASISLPEIVGRHLIRKFGPKTSLHPDGGLRIDTEAVSTQVPAKTAEEQPSLRWSRSALIEYAKEKGIVVDTTAKKTEIMAVLVPGSDSAIAEAADG